MAEQLGSIEYANNTDSLVWLRQQVGSRTVSRLIEICDLPVPMMGSDLRMRQGA